MNLVSITTSEENEFVRQFANDNQGSYHPIIGLKKDGIDGQWAWRDSSLAAYTNWGYNEPDGDGDCAFMWFENGKWHDFSCTGTGPFICEKN